MVKVNVKGLNPRLESLIDKGKYALANQVLQDSNLFVPKRTGQLRRSSYVTNSNSQIVWNTPYATKQYYEQATKYTTSGTGSKWDLLAQSKYGASWSSIVGRAMK